MKRNYCCLILCVLSILVLSHAQAKEFTFTRTDLKESEHLSKYFYNYTVYKIPLKKLANYVSESSQPIALEIVTNVENFKTLLTVNDMRSTDYKAISITENGEVAVPQHPANTYKSDDENDTKNTSRLTVDAQSFEGYIMQNGELFYFDPAARFISNAPADIVIMYRATDVVPLPNSICGAAVLRDYETNQMHTNESLNITGGCLFTDVATEADYEFYQAYGSNVNATLNRIRTILNGIEGLYTSTFKVKFVLRYQQVWTISNDPYSGDSLNVILPQFKSWWDANRTSVTRDITHMFTGRTLIGNVIGLAYTGGVCNTTWYYGCVSNYTPSNAATLNLSAHELGHNFGAGHDTVSACNTSNTMCPYNISSGLASFSSLSVNQINSYLSGTSCLIESFPNNTFLLGGFGNYSFLKLLALSNIDLNSAAGEAIILIGGFGYIEAGNQIVLAPTNANSNGFWAQDGSTVLLRVSDLSNSCLPPARVKSDEIFEMNALSGNLIVLYPNPANDFITLKITDANSKTTIKIYNSTMQLIKTLNFENGIENTISTADLTTGIYFIDAQTGGESFKSKFVVNR